MFIIIFGSAWSTAGSSRDFVAAISIGDQRPQSGHISSTGCAHIDRGRESGQSRQEASQPPGGSFTLKRRLLVWMSSTRWNRVIYFDIKKLVLQGNQDRIKMAGHASENCRLMNYTGFISLRLVRRKWPKGWRSGKMRSCFSLPMKNSSLKF